jgi:epoxyqueuosine reductase
MVQDKIQSIYDFAKELGFVAFGYTNRVKYYEIENRFREHISLEYHAKMDFLKTHANLKLSLSNVLENCKSVFVFAYPYKTFNKTPKLAPFVSGYALEDDYHQRLISKLKLISELIKDKFPCETRVCVDTAPVPERYIAYEAGLGWIGKSSNLIVPGYGPNVYIGEILTTQNLPDSTKKVENGCKFCNLCEKLCPTNAIKDGFVDSRKCLSYYTTELRETCPENLREKYNGGFLGCEVCVSVCPQNKQDKLKLTGDYNFINDKNIYSLDLEPKSIFKNSVLSRFSKKKILLNYPIALATGNFDKEKVKQTLSRMKKNSKDENLIEIIEWAENYILFN